MSKKEGNFWLRGEGGKDPSSYFFQSSVDIDFNFVGFTLNVLFIDTSIMYNYI